jgi:hypothetical protein
MYGMVPKALSLVCLVKRENTLSTPQPTTSNKLDPRRKSVSRSQSLLKPQTIKARRVMD